MLYKFNRWLWLKCNKKPPTKLDAYMLVVGPWFMAGLLLPISVLIFTDNNLEAILRITLGVVVLAVSVFYMWVGISDSLKRGTIGKIRDLAVERWEKKNKEYGIGEELREGKG